MPAYRDAFEAFCSSLEGVSAAPHFDRTAFKVNGRTFATLGAGDNDLNIMGEPGQPEALAAALPFISTLGGWSRMGVFHVAPPDDGQLAEVFDLIEQAWATKRAMKPVRPRKPKS
jgi:hypothetical protein